MSIITSNPYAGGFIAGDPMQGEAGSAPSMLGSISPPNDGIHPIVAWPSPYQEASSEPGAASTGAYGGFIANLIATMQNALERLSALFSGGNGTSSPADPENERFMQSATANSVGDPHESVRATTGSGASISARWDSMDAHSDLLDSDSFDGGYRVSTTATAPSAEGVTLNASATVGAQNGATSVSFNGDGSYAVTSGGANVALEPGRPVSLGDGERVTLGEDSSVTISDRSAAGGEISTTLRANRDGGVDVTNSATRVDLDGYLITREDGSPATPGAGPAYDPYAYPAYESYATSQAARLGSDGELDRPPIELA